VQAEATVTVQVPSAAQQEPVGGGQLFGTQVPNIVH
jgi:hypothetical protein